MKDNNLSMAQTFYTSTHEWVQIDDHEALLGITQKAKDALGDIVYIDLPKEGSQVFKDEPSCILESTKAAIDLYSPVSGEVIAVNHDLASCPSKLKNSEDFSNWFFKVKLIDLKEVGSLLSLEQYQKLLSQGN